MIAKATPLAGIRVADFCWVGAGSYTTKLLADLGADVIKIESAERLDSLRLARPFAGGQSGMNRSGYFADRNTSKRSITINLKHENGPGIARRLILASDVTTNNFTPGTLDKLGLGYQAIRAEKPDIIFAEMSMQGATGPARAYLGYGAMIAALCGLHHLTGEPGKVPTGTGTNYPDHIPNPCHAAFAILSAVRHHRRTGVGQYIDIAQTEPTMAMLGPVFAAASLGDAVRPRGNQHLDVAPHGVYPCQGEDRWIAIVVRTDQNWRTLVEVFGAPDGLTDPRFASVENRFAHRAELDTALAAETAKHDADDLMQRLQACGIAAGVVRDAKGVVDDDPQLAARGHWARLDHPEAGETLYNAPPFRFADKRVGLRSRAPLLGEHTEAVCRDVLAMTDEEITSFTESGALR